MHESDRWLAQLCQETGQRPGAPCVGSADKHSYAATGNCLHIHVFPMSLSLHASAMLQRWSAICRQCHLQAAMPSPSDMLVAFAFLLRGHAQTHMQDVPYPHPAGPSRPDTLPDGSNKVPARNNVVRATLALWAGKRMHKCFVYEAVSSFALVKHESCSDTIVCLDGCNTSMSAVLKTSVVMTCIIVMLAVLAKPYTSTCLSGYFPGHRS